MLKAFDNLLSPDDNDDGGGGGDGGGDDGAGGDGGGWWPSIFINNGYMQGNLILNFFETENWKKNLQIFDW